MPAWQPTVESVGPDGACVCAVAPAESPWFGGHFPSEPVLPGVAMLSLVEETVRVFVGLTADPPLDIVGFRRVRFRHMVRPGDALRVTVRKGKSERAFEFQVDADGNMACSGTCTI
jgi:3-hydroxymyristoyl/3-hydroxydecanoyl-(acyl carrier protein) dehydratase